MYRKSFKIYQKRSPVIFVEGKMDINFEVAKQAGRRWQNRRPERDTQRENLVKGNISAVESPERIQKRLERLADHAASPRAVIDPAIHFSLIENFAMERVLGKDDISSINMLELALAVGRFVGRVCICSATGRVLGFGTGFMVSNCLLLTNNHVLPSAASAAPSRVEFDYQLDRFGRQLPVRAFRLDPARFFLTDPKLDFTLVAVKPVSEDQVELKFFAWTMLIENQGKALIGDPLNIIQHPKGEPKQIAFRNNRLVDLFDQFAHYETDTEPGSSGSPVFNDQWEVVALHHSGVPMMKNGQFVATDGTIWKPGMDPARLAWVANEGIRVSSLMERIKQEALVGEQARLRDEMIQLAPPSPFEIAAQFNEAVGGVPRSSPSTVPGEVVINIPLQITVKIGTPQFPGAVSAVIPGSGAAPSIIVESPLPVNLPAVVDDGALSEDPDLQAALAELDEAETRVYYDETADLAACEVYYQALQNETAADIFFRRLSDLLGQTHATHLIYKPARHVYPWVDLHQTPDGLVVHSIYSGFSFSPRELIEVDFRMDFERARLAEIQRTESVFAVMSEEARLDAIEAALPYNCEHVVPQSWFNKKEPMRGDLHHLFALESGCNSFRGNTPYFDFADFEEVVREGCGKREIGKFEPNTGKGSIARAVLYFLLRYPGEVNRGGLVFTGERLEVVKQWHMDNPPALYEKHRNQAIFAKQGNRNPLIDHPEWAALIDFSLGLSSP